VPAGKADGEPLATTAAMITALTLAAAPPSAIQPRADIAAREARGSTRGSIRLGPGARAGTVIAAPLAEQPAPTSWAAIGCSAEHPTTVERPLRWDGEINGLRLQLRCALVVR